MQFENIEQTLLCSLAFSEDNKHLLSIGGNPSEFFFLLTRDLFFKQGNSDFSVTADDQTVTFTLPTLQNNVLTEADILKMREGLTNLVKDRSDFQTVTFDQVTDITFLQSQNAKSFKVSSLVRGLELATQISDELTSKTKTVNPDQFANLPLFAFLLPFRSKVTIANIVKYNLDDIYGDYLAKINELFKS